MIRLYPRRWRERYGAELEALLRERRPCFGDVIDIMQAAIYERFHPVPSLRTSPRSSPGQVQQGAWRVFTVGGVMLLGLAVGLARTDPTAIVLAGAAGLFAANLMAGSWLLRTLSEIHTSFVAIAAYGVEES